MKKLIMLLALMVTFIGCKDKEKKVDDAPMSKINTESKNDNVAKLEIACYVYDGNGDLVKLEITQIDGNNVSGNLNYSYAEKDKNVGTFKGVLSGDELLGKYSFMSEGRQSVQDVAFKVQKNQVVEGFGDLMDDGATFKNISKINYRATRPWKKRQCNLILIVIQYKPVW